MSGTQQVDSQSLRDTGGAFAAASGDVEALIATVAASVGALVWTGGIAEQFRDDFTGRYKPMLEQSSIQEADSRPLGQEAPTAPSL
jgi:hypothetical protein